LSVENYCCALSNVYTFGPTFRAENSHTSRHLAEFWMIEPELAFANITDDMDCAEDYLKYCVKYAMDHNREASPDRSRRVCFFLKTSPKLGSRLGSRLRRRSAKQKTAGSLDIRQTGVGLGL
ncbi:unnamed protein product, partial [Polarella glacialis]